MNKLPGLSVFLYLELSEKPFFYLGFIPDLGLMLMPVVRAVASVSTLAYDSCVHAISSFNAFIVAA